MTGTRILTCVLLCILCLLGNHYESVAQNITGTILGTVRDPQGAVVPNASVSAKNVETGAERPVLTDVSGGFSIASVPAGSYDVTVLASGFQTEVRSGITMTVGAAVRLDDGPDHDLRLLHHRLLLLVSARPAVGAAGPC